VNRFVKLLLMPFFVQAAMADTVDFDLLKLHAKVLPRVLQMSLPAKAERLPRILCLMYEPMDSGSASVLAEFLEKSAATASGPSFVLRNVTYAQMQECADSQALFLFETSASTLKQVLQMVKGRSIFVAAYSEHMLKEGADYSLHIGRTVKPYLNLQTLSRKGISVAPVLLRISKLYDSRKEQP
jgi:hypothetical protein